VNNGRFDWGGNNGLKKQTDYLVIVIVFVVVNRKKSITKTIYDNDHDKTPVFGLVWGICDYPVGFGRLGIVGQTAVSKIAVD